MARDLAEYACPTPEQRAARVRQLAASAIGGQLREVYQPVEHDRTTDFDRQMRAKLAAFEARRAR
jgi:hypothetical protein